MTTFRARFAVTAATAAVTAAAVALSLGTASASPAGRQAKAAAGLPVVKVAMNGKSITVSGALVSGGVRVVSTVKKEQAGAPTFVRLDPGVTLADLFKHFKQVAADPNNLEGLATLVMSAEAPKGTSSVEVTPRTRPVPGARPGRRGRTPCRQRAVFTIAKASSPARLPAPAATVTSIEFGFRGPSVLHDGQIVRFANAGFLVHMIVAIRASSRANARRLAADLKAGRDRKAQRHAGRRIRDVDGGIPHRAVPSSSRCTPGPGFWVLACFMDTQDRGEHTLLGMERVIKIVK